MAESDLEALGWNEDADGRARHLCQVHDGAQGKELVNSNVVTATTDNLADAFVNGKAAFVSQGMWALATMQGKNPDFKSIGFMAYPSIMPDTKPSVGGPLEGQIAISASSSPEEIAAAKKVLERMTSPDAMKAFCEKNGTIPPAPMWTPTGPSSRTRSKRSSAARGWKCSPEPARRFQQRRIRPSGAEHLCRQVRHPERFCERLSRHVDSAYEAANG